MIHVTSPAETTQASHTADMGLGSSTRKCHVLSNLLPMPTAPSGAGKGAPEDWEPLCFEPLHRDASDSKQTSKLFQEVATAGTPVGKSQRNKSKEDRRTVHYSSESSILAHKMSKASVT